MIGTIKYYNANKGYGFIRGNDQLDYFFHISDVIKQGEIRKESIVQFNVTKSDRGPKATEVQLQSLHTTSHSPKIVIINNYRIFLTKIKEYALFRHNIHYRNEKDRPKPEKGFINWWKFSSDDHEDSLWDSKEFQYIKIKMYDGTTYRFYSDPHTKNLKEKMEIYFQDIHEYGGNKYDHYYQVSYKSIEHMNEYEFIYTNQPIQMIVSKIDHSFSAV